MKKPLLYLTLTVALLAGLWTAASPQIVTNAITRAILQSRAWTFTPLQTFSGGANVTGGYHRDATSLNVTSGSNVGFEGQSGDTHLRRETTTASLESTLDGARGWSVIGGVLQAPDCPTDLNTAPPGWCYDATTGEHVIVGGFRSFP